MFSQRFADCRDKSCQTRPIDPATTLGSNSKLTTRALDIGIPPT